MPFYVAHRLFAAHDRALAADLADRLATKVGPDRVFLPFCDTDEEDLVAEVKGRRLFELDRDRLGRLDAMIAILHGPSLDDGVCMEIGYAIASGVPVVVLTTDFQTYSMTEASTRLEFPDPILQAVATRIVRVATLGPSPLPPVPGQSRFKGFQARNAAQTSTAVDTAIDTLLDLPGRVPLPTGAPVTPGAAVYVEPSPYLPRRMDHLAESVAGGGHTVVASQRFTVPEPIAGALADLAAVRSAARLLVDVSGPETPPGAALLIGAALASGVRVAAFQSYPTFTHAHGREPNWRNLMIQYAVDARFSSDEAALSWLVA
ncbi:MULTISPECIES: nucleoside 2-deoxyribosyltransferase [unclassified Streptomyces]|uniref:nucleoside 2-deoxyribosyltransferase n=1 Tax=unclassified Streptomyces TaxID=2593676 RepID=UPI0036E00418